MKLAPDLLLAGETTTTTKTSKIVRSLETTWEAAHELLHLHQHQSSYGDYLVDDRGGTRWWCDLLSAGLLRSRRLDSWMDPHLHTLALKRPTPGRSLLSLTQACRGSSEPGQDLDGEIISSRSMLVDGCHSADHILAIYIHWVFVSLGRAVDRSFPLVAKGRWDCSLGCISSLMMVWWAAITRRLHGDSNKNNMRFI